jgi:hypothetical protein
MSLSRIQAGIAFIRVHLARGWFVSVVMAQNDNRFKISQYSDSKSHYNEEQKNIASNALAPCST